MRTLTTLLAFAMLTMPMVGCDSDGGTGSADDRFPNVTVAADKSAMVGRIVKPDGTAFPLVRIAACSDVECPFTTADADGYFIHNGLNPLPRRFEIFGQYDQYPSIVFRREFQAGEKVDVGDVVLPDLTGPHADWPEETGGTVTIAGGQLELTAGANEVSWPLGTVDFWVQASSVPADQLPPYVNQPWIGKEDGTLAFALIPFDVFGVEPIRARVLTGVNRPTGTKFDVFHCNPLDGRLSPAGTATVDGDGILETDSDATLKDLTFIMFVPKT